MDELDKLIESAVSNNSPKFNFGSAELLEIVSQIFESQSTTSDLSAADDPDKLKPKTGDNSGQSLLDISAISRKLIRGTESKGKTRDVEESFGILKKTNPYIDGLKSASPQQFPERLIEALNYYFSPPDDILNNPCSGLGAMMTRHIVLEAYLGIFEEYNAVSAGFVNENFISSLVGGQTIPLPVKGEKGEKKRRTSIADFKIGGFGVSLKTTKYTGNLTGSFVNLMKTLGIKFIFKTEKGRTYKNDSVEPVHPSGLYYLLFNKKDNSHTITSFRIDRDEIIKMVEDSADAQNDTGHLIFDKSSLEKAKRGASVLGVKFDDIINESSPGISDLATATKSIKLVLPEVETADDENISKILETIKALTEFYSIFSNAVIEFATNPDYEVLSKIKEDLARAAQFEPQILISNECK